MNKKALLGILALVTISTYYTCEALNNVVDVPQKNSITNVLSSDRTIDPEPLSLKGETIKETKTVTKATAENKIPLSEPAPAEIRVMNAVEPEIAGPGKPLVGQGSDHLLAKADINIEERAVIEQSASEAVQQPEAILSEQEIVQVEAEAGTADRERLLLATAPAATMQEPAVLPSSGLAEVQIKEAGEVDRRSESTIDKDGEKIEAVVQEVVASEKEKIVQVEPVGAEAGTADRERLLMIPAPAATMQEPADLPSSGLAGVQIKEAGEVYTVFIEPTIEKDADEIEAVVQEVVASEKEDDIKAAEIGPVGSNAITGDEKDVAAVVETQKTFPDFKITTEFSKKESIQPVSEVPIDTSMGRVAVLPFDNFSSDDFAVDRVMPALIQKLEKQGFWVTGEKQIVKFLCSEGVRVTGFVPGELALKAQKELQVNYIMAGAIVNFSATENPEVGILARLIDAATGFIVWADYSSMTGEDFTRLLGRGKVKSIDMLIDRAVDQLFADFSPAPAEQAIESTYTVAVMPFQNKSEYPYAGKIATYMFIAELFRSTAFTPVEFGDIRKFVVDFRIRNKGDLDYRSMDAALARLRAGSVLLGSVDDYIFREDPARPPTVVITARLLDAGNKKILWYNSLRLDGADDIIAFDWGRVRTVDKVAHKTVSELVENLEKTEWF